jgi:DNA modification methylase
MTHTLHLGDCRTVLATLDDASIDAIVCDPPYELGFMGKAWDNSGIAYDVTVWQQCLRVLKPGGHLIAFGGSRTYHRLAVAIEDAGFEIRDQIQWIYGSGFPKSLDVSKAMDKQRHDRAQTLEVTAWIRQARDNAGLTNANIDNAFGMNGMAGHWTSQASQPAVPTLDQIPVLLDLFGMTLDDVPDNMRTLIWTLNGHAGEPGKAWGERAIVTEKREDMFGEYEVEDVRTMVDVKTSRPGIPLQISAKHQVTITAPSTDIAKQWQGWGTALKPAHEPAVLARKPLCGTVADNVTAWGVGALNIDGTRIATDEDFGRGGEREQVRGYVGIKSNAMIPAQPASPLGRWPANVIFDEEAASLLGEPSRFFYTVPNEYNCCLCYNTCAKDMTTEEICKHILVSNAANHGWITQETNEFTAHVIALLTQNAQLALNVKSAIPQCALCATSIAVALVEIRTLGFNHQRCERILGYMPKFANSILIRSLASFAELWGNTDIIPTTQNLLMLYGSALHAIENYIKQESKARVGGDNDQAQATRFLYNAKASKAEREAGLYYEEWRVIAERDKSGNFLTSDWCYDPRSANGGYENKPTQPRANHHPTVKPLSLMRYLVRLVTPKGGKVLDPFMGSGSTGCAAVLEGCDFVGIDITPEYVAIAQKRIAHYAVESPLMNL